MTAMQVVAAAQRKVLNSKKTLSSKQRRHSDPSEKNIDRIVGQRLREARVVRGFSQTELGKQSGITFQQVQKYEKGVNRISVSRLLTFSKALGISPVKLFEGLLGTVPETVEAIPKPQLYLLRDLARLSDDACQAVAKFVSDLAERGV